MEPGRQREDLEEEEEGDHQAAEVGEVKEVEVEGVASGSHSRLLPGT